MLAVMTYNLGCFLAVLVGLGLGYVIFFDFSPSVGNLARGEACHVRLLDEE